MAMTLLYNGVTIYHRPLSRYINMLIASDFVLTQMVEPVLPSHAVEYGKSQRHTTIPSVTIIAATRS